MSEKICGATGKVSHRQLWEAERAARRVNNASLGIYRCRACGGWHLGREASRAADRITQLLNRPR